MTSTPMHIEPDKALVPHEGDGVAVHARDFLTFAAKLLINASSEVVMLPLAGFAFVLDLLTGRTGRDSRLHQVLRLGRRWDRWLRTFRPASEARTHPDGLGKSAVAGADQLVASLEGMIASGELPARYRAQVQEWAALVRTASPGKPEETRETQSDSIGPDSNG